MTGAAIASALIGLAGSAVAGGLAIIARSLCFMWISGTLLGANLALALLLLNHWATS